MMSDANATPTDNAIEAIDERVRQLDADIDASTRRLEVDTAIRTSLLELRATIGRKPRARRTARVIEAEPAAQDELPGQAEAEPVARPALWGSIAVDEAA